VPAPEHVLVIAGEEEHPRDARAWGTGGWTSPEQREARDWLALARVLGLATRLAEPEPGPLPAGVRAVLLGAPPSEVDATLVRALEDRLAQEPVLLVARAAPPASPLARLAGCHAGTQRHTGLELRWHGPGDPAHWRLDAPATVVELATTTGGTWLTLDGCAAAHVRRVGRGIVATLAAHPSALRDAGAGGTGALRRLLWAGGVGEADPPLADALVLRMDDPGGAQNVHLEPFAYRELGADEWRSIARVLRRHEARLSVAAVPGWVDDGDPSRGELRVRGRSVPRVPGRVHASWDVTYLDASGALHDYAGEFAVLRELVAEGLVDVALHGHTHLHPDLERWARAPDRHGSPAWFRDVGERAAAAVARLAPTEHPVAVGARALATHFGRTPVAAAFPGDEWTTEALERTMDVGVRLVSSYYLGLADDRRLTWAEHVCAPYLDEPDARWFGAGLPVVGYFHAQDVAQHGVEWLDDLLCRWCAVGARRIVAFDDVAEAVG